MQKTRFWDYRVKEYRDSNFSQLMLLNIHQDYVLY